MVFFLKACEACEAESQPQGHAVTKKKKKP